MDVSCSDADLAPVSLDFRHCASVSPGGRMKSVHKEETYVDMLARASLQLVRKELPVEVQCHAVWMLRHLLCFRKEELSSTNLEKFKKVLVGSLDDFVLNDATYHFDALSCKVNLKENNKRWRCLLVALAARETFAAGNAKGGKGMLNLLSNSSSNSDCSGRSSGIWAGTHCGSLPEDFGDIVDINNAWKDFVEIYPAIANGEMISSHQGKGSLLLMEHNIICKAFLTLIYHSGIQQYEEILACLLSLLKKIWTLPDWRSRYLYHGSGLTSLFSDNQFLEMIYHLVRLCEVELIRSKAEVFTAVKYSGHYIVTLLPSILFLVLEVLQCIHSFPDEHTKNVEGTQAIEIRALIEGIRESGYKVIGLCATVKGAFPVLLNGSISDVLLKYLDSLEFRHLGKLIKHTVVPLIKNCPYMFYKDWVDGFLQPVLWHCENILHEAWFNLLYYGRAGAPYYFGKLCGLEGTTKTLERDILFEFTREFSSLLEAVALTEQNAALPLSDAAQDLDNIPSTSLFRYLVTNDCFGKLRMSLFGYFVDDIATEKAIPFCRALVCSSVHSKDARIRIFVMDNLLPCLIQHLDNKLPCAIQRLKRELNSSASVNARSHKNSKAADNVHLGLVVLCQELYVSGYVQTQALKCDKDGCNAENTFKAWLRRQQEDFRTKAYSAAAKRLPSGTQWNWELEDECQRFLSVYIGMLRLVDETDDFSKKIYVDKESLFQKLSPEFRSNYAIKSCAHPYMNIISSIQHRKFYSMADAVRSREICTVIRKLIKLKPCIKGSDHTCDVVHRLERTSEVPPELSKHVTRSVEILLHFVLFFWEPRFHPLIRQAIMDKLLDIVDELTARERCLEPLAPLIRDFPLHLQPYAHALIETKLLESKYFDAIKQIKLHEGFDEFLASGKLDDDLKFIFSKVCMDELVANKVPSQFWELDPDLRKLSFERRAKIVHMHTETCSYIECLRGLFANEKMKVEAQSLIGALEAEGFFDVDSKQIDWGKTSFSELVEKFNSKLFLRSSLPKHYAIRGVIDCRAILLQKDIKQQEALEKVLSDVGSSLNGYLEKFWKKTRHYDHQYYDIVRNPLKQVNWGPRARPF